MNWIIDTSHSSIDFSVRHMGISTVRGRFRRFEGGIATDDQGRPERIEATIDTASIDTGDEKRDAHLRSADFFDAESHPHLVFTGNSIEGIGGHRYRIGGELTMHGQTRPVVFEAEVGTPIRDPFGLTRTAATVSGRLNRKDWGLTWNQLLEAGALLVSEEVRFELDLQATASQEERTEGAEEREVATVG